MSEPRAISLREMAAEAGLRLAQANESAQAVIENPSLEARWLVEQVSGYEGAEYVMALDEPATARMVSAFDAMLARRLAGEPLQYVLGRWGFRKLDVMVDRRVLIPRPETEQVVEVAIKELRLMGSDDRPTTVVDLGTGSGVIALSIAMEVVQAQVWAVDRSSEALEVARANLAGLGRPAERVRILESNWFDSLPDELRLQVDLIVANPPYIAEHEMAILPADVADWEPIEALISGPSGREDLHHIITTSPAWLTKRGALILECASHQVQDLTTHAKATGFNEVTIFNDLSSRPRGITAHNLA
ncbi:MAG: peptide chain release factor N(5)-glutamine methyltransferase [Acidimicrobiales bacterium]